MKTANRLHMSSAKILTATGHVSSGVYLRELKQSISHSGIIGPGKKGGLWVVIRESGLRSGQNLEEYATEEMEFNGRNLIWLLKEAVS